MKRGDVGPATALASLNGVGPARLRALLSAGSPAEVWQRLIRGDLAQDASMLHSLGARAEDLLAKWRQEARSMDPDGLAHRSEQLGLRLLDAEDADYPADFRDDPEPPLLLWVAGDISRMGGRRVAIVGTRRCTRYGHDVARRFGEELSVVGVSVISGLALGIDAAAHAGALGAGENAAPPVGVVATGLDVVYPRRNRALWASVASRGVLFSEAPPGAQGEAWRFPARNRLIAALAEMVIVVESADRGGSLYTVDEAIARDIDVRAVPGPITAPSSVGTNRLLAEGAAPALGTEDILESLGVDVVSVSTHGSATRLGADYRDPEEACVLDVLTTGSVTFDELAERSGLPIDRLALVSAKLQVEGALVRSGGWYERAG